MGNIISNMGLYDLFARGVTGVVVLCAAHVFCIVDILGKPDYVWVLILCGYFLGLIASDVSPFLRLSSRSRAEAIIAELLAQCKMGEFEKVTESM